MIKIPLEIAENIVDQFDSEFEDYKYIESTPWKVVHKYNTKDFIFSYKDKYYSFSVYDMGDGWCSDCYHTPFYRTEEFECPEVRPVEVKKIIWEKV